MMQKRFIHNKFYIIGNCSLLQKSHIQSLNLENKNCNILHMNYGNYRKYFSQSAINHHLVASTHEHAANGKITMPPRGGIYGYGKLQNKKHLYETINFLFFNIIIDSKLNPWYDLYQKFIGNKNTLLCKDLHLWKNENNGQILPSSGFRTIHTLKQLYPQAEIHLIGFIGHHMLPNGIKYGLGHSLDYEQKWIRKNIPANQLHFCSLNELKE